MSRLVTSPRLTHKLDALPECPGVYMMKGRDGDTIYVGKASNLRRRVRSYFQPRHRDGRRRYRSLVRCSADVDYVLTETEEEALVLEALQIRGLRPRFNVALKECREYPFVRITAERFPRLLAAREFSQDRSRYLGPFSDIRAMHVVLDFVIARFGLRTCTRRLPCTDPTPCLQFHLHRCTAPCNGNISESRYGQAVDEAILVFEGAHEEVLTELHTSMRAAANAQAYEQARRCRDQIRAIEFMRNRQKVWLDTPVNRDVIGLSRVGDRTSCSLLAIRDGHLQGSGHWVFSLPEDTRDIAFLLDILQRRYTDPDAIPDEIQAAHQTPPPWALEKLVGEGRCPPVWMLPGGTPQVQGLADFNARRVLETASVKML